MLIEAVHRVTQRLSDFLQAGFSEAQWELTWKYQLAFLSYWCGIPVENGMFGVRSGVQMYPCVQSLVSKHYISALKTVAPRPAYKIGALIKSYRKHFCEYKMHTKMVRDVKIEQN